jgi:hypothetical protein
VPGDRDTPVGVPRPRESSYKRLSKDATVEQVMLALHEGMLAYQGMAAEQATLAAECRDHMRRHNERVEVVSAEVVVLGAAVRHVTGRVSALEMKLANEASVRMVAAGAPPPLPSMRPEATSWHDYDNDWELARKLLHEKVKDPSSPITSIRAREISEEVVKALEAGAELGTWRKVKAWPAWLLAKGAEHLVTLLVGGGAVLLWHYLSTHR